jgi:hypothetical protein
VNLLGPTLVQLELAVGKVTWYAAAEAARERSARNCMAKTARERRRVNECEG